MVRFCRQGARSLFILFGNSILASLVTLEAVCLVSQILRGLIGNNSLLLWFIEAESSVFYAPAGVTPALVSVIFFCWPFLFAINAAGARFRPGFVQKIKNAVEPLFAPSPLDRHSLPIAALSVCIVLAITLYPYLPLLNIWGKFVGVDIPFYHRGLLDLAGAGDPVAVVTKAFTSYTDRPLTYLILLVLWRLTWLTPMEFVQFYPVVLGVALVSSVYLSSRLFGLSRAASSAGMLFTSSSFHITTGMYGGFLANWTALVFLYIFWGITCAAIQRHSWRLLATAYAVSALILLAHAYTWAMNLGVLFVFVALSAIGILRNNGNGERLEFIMPALLLALGALPFLLMALLLKIDLTSTEGYMILISGLSVDSLLQFTSNLSRSVSSYKGLTFVNPPLFAMSLAGLLFTFLSDRALSRVLKSFVIASSVPFLLGNYIMQSRIMYNVPFQVLGLMGLASLVFALRRHRCCSGGEKGWFTVSALLIFALFILMNLNYALRCSYALTTIAFFPLS